MNPAYSVIFFSSASGAGYGLLFWVAVNFLLRGAPWSNGFHLGAVGAALVLISAGLLASLLHLGHPERAWRAMSQWRSSWLSREGVLALLCYLPALLLGLAAFTDSDSGLLRTLITLSALGSAILAVATVAATGMIYASLKPIPQWHNVWVSPVYVAFAFSSGSLWFSAIAAAGGHDGRTGAAVAALATLAAWGLKWVYWRSADSARTTATVASALGLERGTQVREFEPAHTAGNFVMKEMGFRVARKHSAKLRRIALTGAAAAILCCALGAFVSGLGGMLLATLALLAGMSAILVERWLFFAEARHAVTLYYGATTV